METTKKYREIGVVPKTIKFGFFKEATYEDGTTVPTVAMELEFGQGFTKETAFFRKAISSIEDELDEIILGAYNKSSGELDYEQIGMEFKQKVQEKITELGLIDTGFLRKSVAYKVEEV